MAERMDRVLIRYYAKKVLEARKMAYLAELAYQKLKPLEKRLALAMAQDKIAEWVDFGRPIDISDTDDTTPT